MRFVQYEGRSEAQEEGGAVHEEHVEHTVSAAVVGGWWLVVGGWWLVVGGWWLVVGGWWLVVGYGFRRRFH